MWSKYLSNNVWRDFRLPMSASAIYDGQKDPYFGGTPWTAIMFKVEFKLQVPALSTPKMAKQSYRTYGIKNCIRQCITDVSTLKTSNSPTTSKYISVRVVYLKNKQQKIDHIIVLTCSHDNYIYYRKFLPLHDKGALDISKSCLSFCYTKNNISIPL